MIALKPKDRRANQTELAPHGLLGGLSISGPCLPAEVNESQAASAGYGSGTSQQTFSGGLAPNHHQWARELVHSSLGLAM